MRYLAWLLLLLPFAAHALVPACGSGVTVGTLTLKVYQPRTSCISPCLLFFDSTGSPQAVGSAGASSDTATLPGANNAIQDVYYAWSFGDPNASGTGKWAYGSRPNQNSMNVASGPIAAHLYVLPTGSTTDLNPIVEVWAYDGTNIATCTITVTIFAPSGAHGFSGTSTVCVTASATIGSGCPAGAVMVTNQGNMGTALTNSFGSNQRVLFKCGDTFTGTYSTGGAVTTGSIGAYGGCENTTTNRPIFSNTSGTTLNIGGTDIRVADIDFEDGTHSATAVQLGGVVSQDTVYNTNCNGLAECYNTGQSTQSGLIQVVQTGQVGIGTFLNSGGSACINGHINTGGTTAPWDGTWCGNAGGYQQSYYQNISYNALIGSSFDGTGTGGGAETVRVGVCRMCVFTNSTYKNSAPATAVLKVHEGHYNGSNNGWDGQMTEINEFSDNLFTGVSGGSPTSYAPQNTTTDERIQYGIFERNIWLLSAGQGTGPLVAANLTTHRNNVVYSTSTDTPTVAFGYFHQHQGGEPVETANEDYNNTCYGLEAFTGPCVQMNYNNGFVSNTLFFTAGGTNIATVGGSGTGNTIGNNTTNSTVTFAPVNTSGSFSNLMDFKPTAVFTGAASNIPNYFDASLLSWLGAYTLGAVSQSAPSQ